MKNLLSFAFTILFSFQVQAAFDSADFNKQKDLKITRVTPSGVNVYAQRQITFQFNRPVVAIGKMERDESEIPVEISPKLNCQWRWLNTSSLACQLDEKNKLKLATTYNITMNQGIKAEDGAMILEAYNHEFTTKRPDVSYGYVINWINPTLPVVKVNFNQPVSKSSVQKTISFKYKGGELSNDNIIVTKYDKDRQNPYYITAPGESYIFDEKESDGGQVLGEEARKTWVISPAIKLPADINVNVNVKAGLASAFGKETGDKEKSITNFQTFDDFEFLGVKCITNDNNKVLVTKENFSNVKKCNPLNGVALSFSSPVLKSQIKEGVLIEPSLSGNLKDYDPWANSQDYSNLKSSHRKDQTYDIWLPTSLKADQKYNIKTKERPKSAFNKLKRWFNGGIKNELKDEFSRNLKSPIDLTFFTDHRKPNFEINHHTAILESQIDSEVPLYVTNIDNISFDYKKLTTKGVKDNQSFGKEVPNVKDVQFAIPLEVRKMLGANSGVIYGKLNTEPYIKRHENSRILFASVTPYQLHVKIGHYNTLVWVTDLATGQPVANAKVRIYKDQISQLSAQFDSLDSAITDESGLVKLKGTYDLDPNLELAGWCGSVGADNCDRLFVRVDKDNEMAVMPLENRFELSTYRASNDTVWSSAQIKYSHIHTWGTTAQGIYRAGDKIQYKLYVRDQNNESYIAPPLENYTLNIIDPTGKMVNEVKEITLSEFGSFAGEYDVPKNAAVGWYRFELINDFGNGNRYFEPMRVLVSDFTTTPFKVANNLNGDLFSPEQEVEIATFAKLHSGGAYGDAETRVTATLKAAYFNPKHPVSMGFEFDSHKKSLTKRVFQKIDNINDKGEAKHSFKLEKEDIIYGHLSVESAVRDDRGKYIVSNAKADYFGVDRLVGLKQTKWVYDQGKEAEIKYIVVNEKGAPVAGTDVNIKIERLETKAAKVKGAGNAYITNYIDEWVKVGSCEGISENAPLTCSFEPKKSGTYKVIANINDTKGVEHSSETRLFVAGSDRVVWRSPNDNSLEIIPEKTKYNIGDKARYLIKNPYPDAKALISVERYGVLKSWVQTLKGSTPVVEFDIEKDYLPGFYLSVIVISPRVETAPPKFGQVDLGKPAFKMGYVKVAVKDPYKQIDVNIKTDKEVYKPREEVKVTINAKPKHKDKDENIELAVAVIDEAVLDLVQGGADSFDPYSGFNKLDGLDLVNYSLLKKLVGRQKFEKKGANAGGDGGADISVRGVDKNIAYWNDSIVLRKTGAVAPMMAMAEDAVMESASTPVIEPKQEAIETRTQIENAIFWQDNVVINEKGEAEIKFPLPDNLTGWRILALAVTPTDRMGLGSYNFKVNRPTQIRPVMPNQVTEGDKFEAGFSVMNRTDKTRNIDVNVYLEGDVKNQESFSKSITLEPYKRENIFFPVEVANLKQSRDIKEGEIKFTAYAEDASDGDAIKHSLKIHKRRSLETAANYGTTTKASVSESLQFPENIYPDVGDVSLTLSPSVIGNIDGAFEYVRDYPYTCWEQKLTKAVMASHYKNLRDYLPKYLEWDKSESLTNDTLTEAANYQAPNGGMAYFISQDQYVSPYLSAFTALSFNWLEQSGYEIPSTVQEKLHEYLEKLLKKNIAPTYYSKGMSATVRAVALAALSAHGKVSLDDLERYRSNVPYMSLFGKAHYLQAALNVSGADKISKEVTENILSHSTQSGGKFSFNEQNDYSYARILSTPTRANCGVLSALTKYGESKIGAELIGDVPFKLVRFITQSRGSKSHFYNTQENIFCLNSLIDYSRIYENVDPDMKISATIDNEDLGEAHFMDLRNDAVTLSSPIKSDDIGVKRKLNISKKGQGRVYYTTRMSYAPTIDSAELINAGIDIRKEYSVQRNDEWVLLGDISEIKRGELVKVDIFVSVPTARNFVVVDDPVPGGLEPVNRDLANVSKIDADAGKVSAPEESWYYKFDDWYGLNYSRWSFYHKEIRHNSVRFYSDYLSAGNYHLTYTAQAIATGEFSKMPVKAMEMYDTDIYGKGLPGLLKVEE